MTRVMLLAATVAAMTANVFTQGQAAAPKAAAAARTITITAVETPVMKWDVTKIAAKPGETLRIVLKAVGAMPKIAAAHNFVLLKGGLKESDVVAFTNEGIMAAATSYIPAAKKAWVLASTPQLIGAGETTEVTFKAPTAPGTYPYLCTFPGHYQTGMKGMLTVQ